MKQHLQYGAIDIKVTPMRNCQIVIRAAAATIPFALFTGILLAWALAALIPQIDYIAHPFLSTNGNRVVSETWTFSLPGEERRGVAHFLVDPQGNKREITFRVTVYATAIYTFILALISLIATGILMVHRKIPFNKMAGYAVFVSLLVCSIVMIAIIVTVVFFFASWVFKNLLATW